MAVDMLVDSTALDAALTATANAIRTKGGTSAQIVFDDETGFAAAIAAIPTGGGLPTGLNAVAYGSYTPANTMTSGQLSVTHNLGINPKGVIIWIPPNGQTGVDYDDADPLTTGNMGIVAFRIQNPTINNTNYITSEIGTLGEVSSHDVGAMKLNSSNGQTSISSYDTRGINDLTSTTFTLQAHSTSFVISTYTFYYIIWG